MAKAFVEVTDTFGGEANYSWVDRHDFEADGLTDRQVERKARALAGLTGVNTRRSDYGDEVRWDVVGANICAFLSYEY